MFGANGRNSRRYIGSQHSALQGWRREWLKHISIKRYIESQRHGPRVVEQEFSTHDDWNIMILSSSVYRGDEPISGRQKCAATPLLDPYRSMLGRPNASAAVIDRQIRRSSSPHPALLGSAFEVLRPSCPVRRTSRSAAGSSIRSCSPY
jgi:hypothetical protein